MMKKETFLNNLSLVMKVKRPSRAKHDPDKLGEGSNKAMEVIVGADEKHPET